MPTLRRRLEKLEVVAREREVEEARLMRSFQYTFGLPLPSKVTEAERDAVLLKIQQFARDEIDLFEVKGFIDQVKSKYA